MENLHGETKGGSWRSFNSIHCLPLGYSSSCQGIHLLLHFTYFVVVHQFMGEGSLIEQNHLL